uniref:Uncharacterized protein n=1 Tax=Trypanosoma congolense (strain IL3000) TaxID=1068625 RepID=G0UTN6_TRYCI|nr:conserved hypothetical protein [Trypanosoma congolense IL3000]
MGLRPTATSASDAATWSNPVTLHRTPDRRRETSYPASEAGNASVCPAQGNEMAGVLSLDAREGENRQERDHGAASGAKWDPVQSVASRVASCAPSKWGSTCPTCGHAEDYEADGPATSRRPVHSSKLVIAMLLLRECQISLSGRYFHAWWRCVVSSGPARGCVDNLAVVVEKVCCGGGGALFNQQASRASKLWNNSGFEQQMIPRNSSADASSITSPEEGTTKANSCTNGCRVVLSRAASSCQSPARICAPFDLKRRDTCAESSVLHSATGAPLGGVNDCVVASLAKSIPKGVWRSPNYRRAPSSAVSKLQVYLDIVQEEESGRRTILERKESAFRSGIQTLANEVLEKDFKDAICKTRAALLRGCSRSRGTPSGSPSGKGVDESRLKPTRQGSTPVAKPSPNKRNLRDELGSIDSAESGNTRLLETDQTVFSPVRTPGNGSPGKSANSHVILGGNGAFVDCDASHDAPKHPTDMGKAAEPGGPSGSSTEGVGVVMQDSPHQVHLESTTEVFPINGNIERRRQSVMSSDELLNFNIQRLVEMDLDVREHEQRVYIANKYRTGLRRIIWICFGNRPCLSKDAGHGR